MISSRRLLQMAKRWMKAARLSRKRISFYNNSDRTSSSATPSEPLTAKGHFVAYTNDGKRHVLPLKWLANDIFGELLMMAEEEFGLPGDGPITFSLRGIFHGGAQQLHAKEYIKRLKRSSLVVGS